ncbi:MAG: methyltransferase domain-containing protein [Candidatus Pacebacteria bacterium]|nr:methyltransferase domain-containing protein [Candidatus Paceibacterota bacterium]
MKNFIKKIYRVCFPLRDIIYFKKLERQLKGMESVLDLGCGKNSPLRNIKKDFYSIGIDLSKEDIKKSKKLKIHNEYRLMNVLDIDKFFPEKSFDVIIALDLIEHLSKKEGRLLIQKMEKLARKKVIIFTPNGFVKQEATTNNPFQKHKSGWDCSEMKQLGYTCIGMNGIKFIPRERGNIILKPKIFWKIIADVSQKITYYIPSLSFQLFCIKNL